MGKSVLFKEELSLIKDEHVREFVTKVLDYVPDYNFTCASSSSGKYHPPEDRGRYGNFYHTKKVVKWAHIFSRVYDLRDLDYDIVVAAALLHDMAKRGIGETPSKHTLPDHPSLMLDPMADVFREYGKLDSKIFSRISRCVVYHYGRWTKRGYKKNVEDFDVLELLVHLADMAAAHMHKVTLDLRALKRKLDEYFGG